MTERGSRESQPAADASSGDETTESGPGEGAPSPDPPTRKHKIPARIPGGARTSTVALGICFVLTALLYSQVRPPPPGVVEEPAPTSETQPSAEFVVPSDISVTSTPETAIPSVTGEMPSTGEESGPSETSTNDESTSQESTFLPGVPIPPQLRSAVPAAPGATGSP